MDAEQRPAWPPEQQLTTCLMLGRTPGRVDTRPLLARDTERRPTWPPEQQLTARLMLGGTPGRVDMRPLLARDTEWRPMWPPEQQLTTSHCWPGLCGVGVFQSAWSSEQQLCRPVAVGGFAGTDGDTGQLVFCPAAPLYLASCPVIGSPGWGCFEQ